MKLGFVTLFSQNWQIPAMEAGQEPWPEYMYYARTSRFRVVLGSIFADAVTAEERHSLRKLFAKHSFALLRKLDLRDCDCLVAAGEDIGLPLCLITAKPIYIRVHGFAPSRSILMQAAADRDNAHFLFLSESLRNQVCHTTKLPPARAHILSHSIDTDFFRSRDRRYKSGLIVAAGTGNRDYPTLVRACENLPVRLLIAADSAWYPHPHGLESRVLPANVCVGSAGSYRRLRALYQSAHFILVPLQDVPNACGYAVIGEAMAMGKAVIATRTQAMSDFIVPNVTGIYVSPGDVEAFRTAAQGLLSDPTRFLDMGSRGKERILRLFTHRHFAEKLDNVVLFSS